MRPIIKQPSIRFRAGDNVKVMSGKNKGKTGKITQVIPSIHRVVIEGVNKMVKHMRSPKAGQPGQRIEFDSPVPVSNVQLVCPKCSKVTRIGHQATKDGKKIRICVKCKEAI